MEKMRILVADDSRTELSCISHLMRQYRFPLEVRTAVNGREALAYLGEEPFDLMLTDIKMPFLDGLSLSKEALTLRPDMQVIIFSGYHEFEYAKTAIGLGVQDYLLKPVDPDEFEKVVRRAIQSVNDRRARDMQIANNTKKSLLYEMVQGIHGRQVYSDTAAAPLDFACDYSHMLLLELDNNFFHDPAVDYAQYFERNLTLVFESLFISQSQILFLLQREKCGAHLDEGHVFKAAESLCLAIASDFCVGGHIALSLPLDPSDSLSQAYARLESLMETRFFYPERVVLTQNLLNADTVGRVQGMIESVERDIKGEDLVALRRHMASLFESLKTSASYTQNEIHLLFANILSEINWLFPPEKRPSIERRIRNLSSSQDIGRLISTVQDVLDALYAIKEPEKTSTSRSELVIKYIHENYDRDLGLEELARVVYVHPHHLCRMFKKETGCNLNKFIKSWRMEKAHELLRETLMKVSAISKAVGYQNLSYFCQTFKEYYGVSPEKYRRGVEDNEE